MMTSSWKYQGGGGGGGGLINVKGDIFEKTGTNPPAIGTGEYVRKGGWVKMVTLSVRAYFLDDPKEEG